MLLQDIYDAQVQAYNELRAQYQAADGEVAELQARTGEVVMERDALHDAGGRLQFSYTLDSGGENFISRNLVDITVAPLPTPVN